MKQAVIGWTSRSTTCGASPTTATHSATRWAITDHEVPHGLAVAWGLDLVNYLAWQRGLLPEATAREIHGLVERWFSCRCSRPISASELIEAPGTQKVADGRLHAHPAGGYGDWNPQPRHSMASWRGS